MKENNKFTASELNAMLSVYQSLITILTFFAGFVFVTIPFVIFSIEISSLYGRLVIYLLLTALLVFTTIIQLYHIATLRAVGLTYPKTDQIRKYREIRIAEPLLGITFFIAFSSISFMLLLKGEEWTIEAIVWFLISFFATIFGLVVPMLKNYFLNRK